MFKSLVFCVLLWHRVCEIDGLVVPVTADNAEQGESKGIQSLEEVLVSDLLLERPSSSSNVKSVGEEIATDYITVKGIGAFKVHRIKLNWNSARQICNEEGGHLAIIRSTAEAHVVRQLMIESPIDDAWVGLHDQFEEGDWISVLDEPISEVGWAYWSPNFRPNPDNQGGNQDCARILKNDGGIEDENCGSVRPFICKISVS